MVLHKDSSKHERWSAYKDQSPIFQRLSDLRYSYDESENTFISGVRSVTEKVGSWFEENETAQVVRAVRALDPTFSTEKFLREVREYVVPEVVDAYLRCDGETLKMWCSEAVSSSGVFKTLWRVCTD